MKGYESNGSTDRMIKEEVGGKWKRLRLCFRLDWVFFFLG